MVALASAFVRVRPDPDKREFRKAGEQMGAEAGAAAGESFGEQYKRGADGKLRDARGKFVKDSDAAGAEGGTRAGKSFGKAFGKSGGGGNQGIFSKVLATTAARYTLVGTAAAGALPAVLKMTAALAPAAGAVVVLPAALAAGAAAAATFKIAVSGVSDAIGAGFTGTAKQAKKALDGLPPSARKFASSIISLKPQVEGLRAAVSERFFRPFADDIKPLTNQYFPLLRKQMSGLAGPLGGLAEQLIQSARSGDAMKAVSDLFLATRLSVIKLRGAIDPLVKSFAALIQSTAPELPGIAQSLTNMAKSAAAFITNAVDTGKVNAAFDAAKVTLKDLAGIIGNVGSILGSVFRSAAAGSGSLLSNLRELTGQAAAFLKTGQGIAGLNAVFSTLATIGAGIRTALGAVLPAIAQSLAVLGPAIAGLVTPAAQIVVALAPLLPIFSGIAATIITKLTPAIAGLAGFLTEHAQVVKIATAAVVAFLAVQKTAAGFLAIQAAGGLIAYIKQMRVVTSVTKIWAGIQAAFNLIMAANPIVLVTLAVAALVAGVIIAYKNSETFRKIVQGAWEGIKTAVKATVDFFTQTVWPVLKGIFQGIADAALWLWRNAILPAWNGIKAVIDFVVKAVKLYITALKIEFQIIATAATWLWQNIFAPVWGGIKKSVEVAWLAIQIIFKLLVGVIRNTLAPVVSFLSDIFGAAFKWIVDRAKQWWQGVQIAFALFRTYVIGPIAATLSFLKAVFTKVFAAVASTVTGWYRSYIAPAFNAVKTLWTNLAAAFSSIYNTKIKPLFNAFVGFIKNTVVGSFNAAVGLIKVAWEKVKEYARKPVAFVVNSVINPFIGGLNKAASIVGVKDRVEPIKGFAAGGKISGTGGMTDNRQAVIPGVGAVQLQGGEYVINRQSTAKALPLLRWVNDGMKGGARKIGSYLGRPLAREPGDGSEGWAFKSGGLVGWANDVWGAISDPVGSLKKPFDAALSKIPGVGLIKDFLVGGARKLVGGAVNWLKSFGGSADGSFAYHGPKSGRIGAAAAFVRAQEGKPYIWADAGPGGYDCSGIVSAAYNVLKGRDPYQHTFSTGSMPGPWFKPGTAGPLVAGWSHPGQRPASASVGHMAGNIAGMAFESTGSAGVRIGSRARGVNQFANLGYAALRAGGHVPVFDTGGTLAPGINVVDNRTGRPERLVPTTDPVTRLHPADLESLGRIIGREMAAAVGAGNYATGRQVGLYTRGG